MNSILWLKETEEFDFSLFKNYKNAFLNYFDGEINTLSEKDTIDGIKNLIIVDEHFYFHRNYILQDKNIEILNRNKTRILIFNTEKIFKQPFKHNLDTHKKIQKFNDKLHFLHDALDIKKLGTPFLNKQLLSKEFKFSNNQLEKENALYFIGQHEGRAYKNRRKVLSQIEKNINIPLIVENTKRKLPYNNFLKKLSKFKFVLNPLGNGKSEFLNIRFYESIFLGAIPVQEYTNRMLNLYDEFQSLNIVKFKKVRELKKVDFNNLSYQNESYKIFMEDYFNINNIEQYFQS
tara:strand:- start:931 stop:1800 length:870 start_codon:yes stop_codon:yes gene_type:complete